MPELEIELVDKRDLNLDKFFLQFSVGKKTYLKSYLK